MQFSEVPEEELQKSAMELDPVVLTCEVSREDANATWYTANIHTARKHKLVVIILDVIIPDVISA